MSNDQETILTFQLHKKAAHTGDVEHPALRIMNSQEKALCDGCPDHIWSAGSGYFCVTHERNFPDAYFAFLSSHYACLSKAIKRSQEKDGEGNGKDN